ncbi:hypothetical protein KIN20_022947 [Parelaphostrongylus tenuis]|uniref:Letm1 RBD domain-containing protein n=1 Tax=Parelaphostrongylus tenuis TaxID=148309 RepID=A0AAD5MQZ3_PARTN|nr:hypothetical protein KIN20_022947 [Parelaphostrongylus tenuis]
MLSCRSTPFVVFKRARMLRNDDPGFLLASHHLCFLRLTSSGPPPSSPPKPGSFSERYDRFVARWPKIYAYHRMVVDGSRWCYSDVKTYIRVRRELLSNRRKLNDLSMDELEVLVQMRMDLPKMSLTAVPLLLPFGFYIIGFAIIFFPRLVLTRHFWTDAQRKEFFRKEVLESMRYSSQAKEVIGNPSSVEDVRLPKLEHVGANVLVALAAVYSMLPLPGIGRRFMQRCEAVRQLDKVIVGNIESLTERQLNFHLFIRRIVIPTNASDSEMRNLLTKWIKFTSHLDDGAYLFAPIFFNEKRST